MKEVPVPITVNNRHVHLSKTDAEKLFGDTHQFPLHPSPDKHVWPGHTLMREQIAITGPKGTISEVSLLGPWGEKTTIEMSTTDAYQLGLSTESIKSKRFSPGVTLTGPNGSIFLPIDKSVKGRWLLVSRDRSEKLGLKDGTFAMFV